MTWPTGRSDGSLHVVAMSPFRAACLPSIITVPLPMKIVALFDGGDWNGPPAGMCEGELVAVESFVAAGLPWMLTSLESEPSS